MNSRNNVIAFPQLEVEDVFITAQYYQDVLNFKVIQNNLNSLTLFRDDFQFEVVKKIYSENKTKKNCQFFDLIWFIPTLDELYEEISTKRQEIRSKIKTRIEDRIYGQRQIEITDCDGHKLLISE